MFWSTELEDMTIWNWCHELSYLIYNSEGQRSFNFHCYKLSKEIHDLNFKWSYLRAPSMDFKVFVLKWRSASNSKYQQLNKVMTPDDSVDCTFFSTLHGNNKIPSCWPIPNKFEFFVSIPMTYEYWKKHVKDSQI